jgi:indolepyruvate ferredoxin oxidoreductase alpha subunit
VAEKKYIMGDFAVTRGAVESGVKVVSGYPGTPATEILEGFVEYPHVHAEWSSNEKVALEVAQGASLAGVRAMAVMKHNGTNVATDMIMHLNFTGVNGGLILISADDPGGLSSQNEQDSRLLVHGYAGLPVFDPCSAAEAKQMTKDAFELSEKTQMCFVLRPVMRVCHSRSVIEFEDYDPEAAPKAKWVDDRDRYIMSAVEVRGMGGIKRPQARHRWLNDKYVELQQIFETLPYNHIEGNGGDIGLIGVGMGYTYLKEAEQNFGKQYPILKLATLPLPKEMVIKFLKGKKSVLVFEEVEPVVENLIKQTALDAGIQLKVLGRSGFYPSDGELTVPMVSGAVQKLDPELKLKQEPVDLDLGMEIPIRTRTQCVGCAHRPLLHNLKRVAKKKKAVVFGDIGCHDAGSFKPLELQSTIYCMGASAPMATGAYFAGEERPVISMMGDSTFFHMGINGLLNATYQGSNQVLVLADNRTTAMTGFQPHAGSGVNVYGQEAHRVDLEKLCESMGAKVHLMDPYDLKQGYKAIKDAVEEEGVSVVLARKGCYLRGSKQGETFFEPKKVAVDQEACTGCMICVNDFGCPALVYDPDAEKVSIDEIACVKCGLCEQVCKFGAIA